MLSKIKTKMTNYRVDLPTEAPAAIITDSNNTSTTPALMSGFDFTWVSKWDINAWITTYAYCC